MEYMIFQLIMEGVELQWIMYTISSEKMIAQKEKKRILKTLKLRK